MAFMPLLILTPSEAIRLRTMQGQLGFGCGRGGGLLSLSELPDKAALAGAFHCLILLLASSPLCQSRFLKRHAEDSCLTKVQLHFKNLAAKHGAFKASTVTVSSVGWDFASRVELQPKQRSKANKHEREPLRDPASPREPELNHPFAQSQSRCARTEELAVHDQETCSPLRNHETYSSVSVPWLHVVVGFTKILHIMSLHLSSMERRGFAVAPKPILCSGASNISSHPFLGWSGGGSGGSGQYHWTCLCLGRALLFGGTEGGFPKAECACTVSCALIMGSKALFGHVVITRFEGAEGWGIASEKGSAVELPLFMLAAHRPSGSAPCHTSSVCRSTRRRRTQWPAHFGWCSLCMIFCRAAVPRLPSDLK